MGTNNRPGQSNTYASAGTRNGVAKEHHKSEEGANVTSQLQAGGLADVRQARAH